MSSIATFYVLPETKRLEFGEAHRNQKTVTYRRGLLGRKKVITGEHCLWEYLDSATEDASVLPFSGSAYLDYFSLFVAESLPADLQIALRRASLDERYDVFSAELANALAQHLQSHPPGSALDAFAAEEHPEEGPEYVQCLRNTHRCILDWFSRVAPGSFGVLHLG